MICTCPQAAAITSIAAVTCLERFGEIQKILIQRTKNGTVINEIVIAVDDPALLATWTAKKAAVDSEKVVSTPFLAEVTNEAPDPREASSTGINGVSAILGGEASLFTGSFHDIPQSIMKDIKDYNCEVEISLFLINESGQILTIADDNTSALTVKGIPVVKSSFYVGDKVFGGREDVDKNNIKWSFPPNFSDELYIVTPTDFNGLEL